MCELCGEPSHLRDSLARRHFLKMLGASAVSWSLVPAFLRGAEKVIPKPENVLSPAEALARLRQGNRRYVGGLPQNRDFKAGRPSSWRVRIRSPES